jgi:hypothetical protein
MRRSKRGVESRQAGKPAGSLALWLSNPNGWIELKISTWIYIAGNSYKE